MCEPTGQIVLHIHASGVYRPRDVVLRWCDEPRPAHHELDRLVAEVWTAQQERAVTEGRTLFNGQLVRKLRHRADNGQLAIDIGPTDYANFLATNVLNPHRATEFGWELYSNPMGTSTAIITADNWLLVGLRSQQVAIHQGYVHAFSGGLEQRDLGEDGCLDPYDGMRRELNEELSITADEIETIDCLALICEGSVRQPELIFDTRTTLTRSQVCDRLDDSDPDQEHIEIVGCPFEAEPFAQWLETTSPIASVTLGGLLLIGQRHFGVQWYETAIERTGVTMMLA